MSALKLISSTKVFGGEQKLFGFYSAELSGQTEISIFFPKEGKQSASCCLLYLSGLTSTWENVVTKAGAQRSAAKADMMFVSVDTSPRGDDVPDEPDNISFGSSAGFYLDATEAPWSKNYRMYSYIMKELLPLLEVEFAVYPRNLGITGHSMGGHGSLTLALKNPDKFQSVSAFAPIASAARSPWGKASFARYLGSDEATWQQYDAVELVRSLGWKRDILIDQGTADPFLEEQLMTSLFDEAAREANVALEYRLQPGYEHHYFFVASFMEDHIKWHADRLY